MNALYVFIGGGLGAVCRWTVSQWVPVSSSGFPTSTFTVNMLGCFLIGLLSGLIPLENSRMQLLLLVGFLGGFTTFSTYGLELFGLQQAGLNRTFLLYLILSNLFGLLFVILGNRAVNVFIK